MRRMLMGLCLVWSGVVAAQTQLTAEVEHLSLDPAGRGSLLVGNGATLEALKFRLLVAGQYSYGHVRSVNGNVTTTLLSDRFDVTIGGALGITDWLQVHGWLPIIVSQTSAVSTFTPQSAGIGTPQLGLKVGILDHRRPMALSLGLDVGLPVGTGAALGNGGLSFTPRVNVGSLFNQFQLGLELGALIRARQSSFADYTDSISDRIGSQLFLAAAVTSLGDGLRGELSLRGFLSLSTAPSGLEALAGVRYPLGDAEVFLLMGPGLGGTPGTPVFRAILGAAYGNGGMTRRPCLEGDSYELADCPDLDRDNDGVTNANDSAPLDPEDKDGFLDSDGKPEPDNDEDGLLDRDDKCPDQKGPKENDGCPDTDKDADGIVDRLDKAPEVPEDKDGFEDQDGAPEPDNDKDGFLDGQDGCPNEAGIKEERGCPAKDDDKDGVSNHLDNCRAEPGPESNQGCPEAKKQLVVVTKTQLKILGSVFFDVGKATIQKKSFALLDQIAAVLKDKTFIKLLQVEGHTDNAGKPEKNKKLSQDRAQAVVEYLVKQGVAASRLKAVGFGQDKPLQDNKTKEGKEANRRVEFNILEQE